MTKTPNFTNIKEGDKVALPARHAGFGYDTKRSYEVLTVTKLTPTQFAAGSLRFRKADGRMVGKAYVYAVEATPEIVAQAAADQELARRHTNARARLNSLEGRFLHNLKLTIEQIEALADAWDRIQAMKPAEVPA